MHIFAMAIGNGTPTMGAPYPSLAAAYDNAGISDNSNPSAANFDGTGESFSAQALAAGTPTPLTPGGQATIGGTTFTWPTPVGAPDNVIADGQIIDMSGSGTDLGFLGAAGFGAASGTGTITYTDGSTQTYSISMADWYNNAPVAGDQIATTTSSWNSRAARRSRIRSASTSPRCRSIGQDRGVRDAADGQQRGRERRQRDAHLRDRDRVGYPDERQFVGHDQPRPARPTR